MYYNSPTRFLAFTLAFTCAISVSAQKVDEKGRKQGYWKKKDEKTGKVLYEGEFRDDKPVGTFKYYYPTDSLRAVVTFRSGGPATYARLYHPGGNKMAEGRYSSPEVKDSVWTYYDEGGALLSRETWVQGKKHGPSFVYLPDGAVSEEKQWKEDREEGPFVQYFEKGKPKARGTYKNGQLEGKTIYYFPNGTEAAAGFYRKGVKHGPWIYRDSKGKVSGKELYEHGKLAGPAETEKFFSKNKVQDASPRNTKTTQQSGGKKNKQ